MSMRSPIAYALALLNGVMILRIVYTGEYRLLVQPGMGLWLVLSGALMTVAAVVRLTFGGAHPSDEQTGDHDHDGAHDHDHDGEHGHHGAEQDGHAEGASTDGFARLKVGGDREAPHRHPMPKVAFLLVAPVAALLIVQPTGLGSFAAGRTATLAAPANDEVFPPLETDAAGVASPGLLELWRRASFDPDNTLAKQPLRLIGFVTDDEGANLSPGSFRLTRFSIACCAADALPVQVRVIGYEGALPPVDSWVEIVGTYDALVDRMPVIISTELRSIPQPKEPYE